MNRIQILSGPINSGKTTRLGQWVKNQSDVGGILCPVIDKKRYFYSINTGRYKILETKCGTDKNVISIGRFRFLNEGFEWAINEIKNAAQKCPEWLVVDEIGPLELSGHGFDIIVKEMLNDRQKLKKTSLLFVVRDNLVNDFLAHYKLSKNEISMVDFI